MLQRRRLTPLVRAQYTDVAEIMQPPGTERCKFRYSQLFRECFCLPFDAPSIQSSIPAWYGMRPFWTSSQSRPTYFWDKLSLVLNCRDLRRIGSCMHGKQARQRLSCVWVCMYKDTTG